MIYGIQASKDVKLSNIARALNEDVALMKTVGRLSRQVTSKDLTRSIEKHLIEEGKSFVGEDTVLALYSVFQSQKIIKDCWYQRHLSVNSKKTKYSASTNVH